MLRSVLLLIACAGPVVAQPPSPLDLSRGLRDAGMPDLALEFLDELAKKPLPSALQPEVRLERAKVRLAQAQLETDESARDNAVAKARGEFEAFLKDFAKHPRAPEAAQSLARVLTLQAKADLSRVGRIDATKTAERKAAAAATRPLFRKASDLYGQASKQIDEVLEDKNTDPARRRELTRDAFQAELDRGINQYNLADTYVNPQAKEIDERGQALTAAKKIFTDLGKRDPSNPISWVARAWVGACELEYGEKVKAEETFKQVRADASRNPAGADGVRMVEYFELQNKFLTSNTAATRSQTRVALKTWLDRDKYKSRMTPERTSITYYYATMTADEGASQVVVKKSNDPKASAQLQELSSSARGLLQEANREYKRLLDSDNEYTDRAVRGRTRVIRLLVGDANKPPDEFTSFEEAHMAALVQLSATEEADRADAVRKAIGLLERCRQLATADVPARDRTEVLLVLAEAYRLGGHPQQAAVLGEYVAHTARGGPAVKGGLIALAGYLTARESLDEAAEEARDTDRDRAMALGAFLDQRYPTDPATDDVRYRLGTVHLQERRFQEAFDILAKIAPTYPDLRARQYQSRAALALYTAKDDPPPSAAREAARTKAIADADAVPEPANLEGLKQYFELRNLVANLHLVTQTPAGYAKAEQTAAAALKQINESKLLAGADQLTARFATDTVRLVAVYTQAARLFREKKYKETTAKLDPSIADMEKSGPAAAAKLEGEGALAADALDKFRQRVVLLALQARIQEGAVDPAAKLFDLLEKLGGSVEATTDALSQLVALVRPQIDELRKQRELDAADKLAASVTALIEKQAAKPKLAHRTLAVLGKSLRDLGNPEKAIEVLEKVPDATEEDLRKSAADLTEEGRAAVVAHRVAKLELIRAYRQTKQFDRADGAVKAALGADGKSGWARAVLDYRREGVLLQEDRAADAPAGEKKQKWTDALGGWTRIGADYRAAIGQKLPADPEQARRALQDREKLVPIYLEVVADSQRCTARANQQLLGDKKDLLTKSLQRQAQTIAEIETSQQKALTESVRQRFRQVLEEYPELLAEYKAKGGTSFLPEESPASVAEKSNG